MELYSTTVHVHIMHSQTWITCTLHVHCTCTLFCLHIVFHVPYLYSAASYTSKHCWIVRRPVDAPHCLLWAVINLSLLCRGLPPIGLWTTFNWFLFLWEGEGNKCRVEAGIMRRMILWDTACNFNAVISNQSIFNCLINWCIYSTNKIVLDNQCRHWICLIAILAKLSLS